MSVVLSVILITTSIPPPAEASWVSDFFGGVFTIITSPIWVFCPNNPTFRKNNPFKQKEWEEEPVNKYNPPTIVPNKKKKIWEERLEEQKQQSELIAGLVGQIKVLKKLLGITEDEEDVPNIPSVFTLLKSIRELEEKLEEVIKTPSQEELTTMTLNIISSNPDRFRGADGKDGAQGQKGDRGDTGAAGQNGEDGQTLEIDYEKLENIIFKWLKDNFYLFTGLKNPNDRTPLPTMTPRPKN
jgi:hypothetical protein